MPPGMKVLASGAGQSLPVVPWIAILDSNVTRTAQEGLYVVYLFRQDLSRVYLSMNQGATQHQRNAGRRGLTGLHKIGQLWLNSASRLSCYANTSVMTRCTIWRRLSSSARRGTGSCRVATKRAMSRRLNMT